MFIEICTKKDVISRTGADAEAARELLTTRSARLGPRSQAGQVVRLSTTIADVRVWVDHPLF